LYLCVITVSAVDCNVAIEVIVPKFNGNSYLQFAGLSRPVLTFYSIEVVFMPTSNDGLLLYNGYSTDRTGDFLSLSLRDGFVEYCFDLGTGTAIIRSFSAALILDLFRFSHTMYDCTTLWCGIVYEIVYKRLIWSFLKCSDIHYIYITPHSQQQ